LIAIQESEHSSIEIYIKTDSTLAINPNSYQQHMQNYIGILIRNYWGTQFTLHGVEHTIDKVDPNSPLCKNFLLLTG